MDKQYLVWLSDAECRDCSNVVRELKGSAQKSRRAQILLMADAEFVAGLEEVLEIYATPYDPKNPVVNVNEQPVQVVGETRVPLPAAKDHPERVDCSSDCPPAQFSIGKTRSSAWRNVQTKV